MQTHGRSESAIGPGNRVALNLAGIDHTDLERGNAVTIAAQWRPTQRFDASLSVLSALQHQVTRRGAYLAYIGSGAFPAKLRVLGHDAIAPGAAGLVRLHLTEPLPLVPGDRFVLRESGRDETVGGGEVLDVAPVLPASKARPDRSVERVVAERGWVDVDDLEALTGERHEPTLGHVVVSPEWLASARHDVGRANRRQPETSGSISPSSTSAIGRSCTPSTASPLKRGGRGEPKPAIPLQDHPYVAALLTGGVSPPDPTGVDRAQLRELLRRGMIVERDDIYFHPATIATVAGAAARLLQEHPDGFTVAQLREDLGVSRKYALPLVNELDARGITRRRGDLRVAGPRLPSADAGSAPA